MPQFQSPSGRVYNWNKPTDPTERDWEELIAFDKAQDAAAQGQELTTNEVKGAGSSEEALKDTVRGIGLEVGGSLAGGAIGTALAPGIGTAVGAAVGGSVGNFLKQLLEQDEGKREEIKGGQVLAAGILSAPGAVFSRAALKAAAAGSQAALGTALQAGAQAAPTVGKTALVRATQAGLATAAANTTEKLIDEGRLPTWQETATETAIGAALGGAAGLVEGRYALKGGFITNPVAANVARAATGAGVAAYAYNDAVEKGKPNPIAEAAMFGALAAGGTYLPAKIMQLEKDKARRMVLGPEALTGKEVVVAAADLQNMLKSSDAYAADLGNAMNEIVAKSKDPEGLTSLLLSVMDRKVNSDQLPPSLLPYYEKWNKLVAGNAEKILELYPNLKESIVGSIERNKGNYIRTAYAAHDPNAVRGQDWDREGTGEVFKKELVDRLTREVQQDGTKMSVEQASAKADAIMARMAGDVAFTGSGHVPLGIGGPGSPTSALQKKHQLSPAAREWLGEIKDPARRVQQTLSAQSRLILHAEHDTQIRDLLVKSGIGSTSLREGYVKLIESDSPTLHQALADMYVPREWAEAWKEVMSPNLIGDGLFAKTYMKLTTTSKALKTVGNIFESLAPQAWGNAAIAASSGAVNPSNIISGIKAAARDIAGVGNIADPVNRLKVMDSLKELRGLGILQGGAEVKELQEFIRMASKENDFTKLLNKFSKVYGSADSAFRFALYHHNLEQAKSFNLGLTEPQLKKYAAEVTKNTFPTYEYIPRRLRQASAATAANSFGAFEFEMVRTVSNQVRYINELFRQGRARMSAPGASQTDIDGGRAMVKAAIKRTFSLGSVAGFTAGLATWGSKALGTDDQDKKDISTLIPQYDANKANVVKINKDGSFSYTPINYLMPYANMTETLLTGLNGGNPMPYVKSMVMGDDYGPLVTPAIEAINNTYYKTAIPITEPRDNAALAMRFVQRAFLPQAITGTLTRTEKALRGEVNKLGTKYTLEDQGLRLLGARQNTMDILASATARIRSTIEPLNGEVTGYRRILKGNLDPATGEVVRVDEPAVYAQRARNYELGQKQLGEQYMALKRLAAKTGAFDDNDIIGAFRQAGVPNRLIAGAVFGYTVPMPRGIAESNGDIIQDILAKPDGQRNILAEIEARSNGDPFKKKQLLSTYKQIRVNDARGGDSITKLFNGLGVSDGERADAIYRAMSARPELANTLKNKLVRTRVMTPDVYRQVKGLVDADVASGN